MEAVILAAGRGTRMHSQLPKVLHTVGSKLILIHVINSAESAGAKKIHVVVGNDGERMKEQVRRFLSKTGLVDSTKGAAWYCPCGSTSCFSL